MGIPNKIHDRIASSLKRMLPIIEQQRQRDVSEADTVTLVKDLFSETFGYDKYADLTGEFAIRGTYCDLAIKIDNKVSIIVEAKAIGVQLDDRHVKQAIDYASNQGCEWVILTNAIVWKLFRVVFAKPIDKKLIVEIDLSSVDLRKEACFEILYLFTKEGIRKGAHIDLCDRQEATNRFLLSALLVGNDTVVSTIRRELRRIIDIPVSQEEIVSVLRKDVIKRDNFEGADAEKASKNVGKNERIARCKKSAKTAVEAAACDLTIYEESPLPETQVIVAAEQPEPAHPEQQNLWTDTVPISQVPKEASADGA